jgi:hypothetical protein
LLDPLAGLRALTTPARSSAAAFTDGQGTNILLTSNRHGRMLKILSVFVHRIRDRSIRRGSRLRSDALIAYATMLPQSLTADRVIQPRDQRG